ADSGYQLTAQKVKDLTDPIDGLIIASPANPTGSIIPQAELSEIVAYCEQKGIRIVSDEIYDRITYTGAVASVSALTDKAAIINSFSKFYMMPGWRLGWALMPEALSSIAHAYMSNFFLTPPSLSQEAGLAAFSCTEELQAQVDVYARNRTQLLEALPAMGITDIAPPDGAFYIYGRVDQWTDDSRDFCMKLLEDTGVATASGVDFDPVDGHRFMRLSFAVQEHEVAEAADRLSAWLSQQPRIR
ncbi:MAG: aminotransferase class I/II-fold pyridoxal phosphate-dependent enzyme, partial [Pseudomonadota bacterium]